VERGFFRAESLKRIFAEHRSKFRDNGHRIWRLINRDVWQPVAIDGEQSKPSPCTLGHANRCKLLQRCSRYQTCSAWNAIDARNNI